MNKVIETLMDHRSIRSYNSTPVSNEDLDLIIKSSQAAASSIHGQQVTIISVRDEEKRKKLAELVGNQAYVAQAPLFLVYCADFYRAKIAGEIIGEEMVLAETEEGKLVGAVDVGLALGNGIAAAESLGLGIVPIGGIRKEAEAVAELLGLPKYVFPMVGLVVGHPEGPSHLKPRFPEEIVHHQEKYNTDLKEKIQKYDIELQKHMIEVTDGKYNQTWSQTIGGIYKNVYYPKVKAALEKQGFPVEK
jgi:FMN reductase [NAD(P)H]